MNKEDMVSIASYAIMKNMDYETLYYCDDMYGKEKYSDDVWEYVRECKEIGNVAFKEKYKGIKLYI